MSAAPARRPAARLIALAAGLLTAGCALGTPRRQPAPQPAAPAALNTLNADATAMIDSATAKDWSSVSAELAGLHQSWTALRPAAASRGARAGLLDSVDSALSDVDAEAEALGSRGTAVAANHLTSYVPDLAVLWAAPVPPQLLDMGYLAREIGLDVQAGQGSALWTDTRSLGTEWAYVRPAAQRKDVGDAARLDLQLADLDAAVTASLQGSNALPAAALPSAAVVPSTVPASASAPGSSSAPSVASSASSAAPASSVQAPASSSAAAPARNAGAAAAPAPVADGSDASVLTAAAAVLNTVGALQRAFGSAA